MRPLWPRQASLALPCWQRLKSENTHHHHPARLLWSRWPSLAAPMLWPFGTAPQTCSIIPPPPLCSPLLQAPPQSSSFPNLQPLSTWTYFIHCVSPSEFFFFFFVLSRLQGDHRPEGKMHGLSHRDVRFRTAGGWDHRSGSGGQVSKKNTALSSEKRSFQRSSKTNEEY